MILRISRFALLVFNWYFHLSLVLKDLIIFGITDASNVYIRVNSGNYLNQGFAILPSFNLKLQDLWLNPGISWLHDLLQVQLVSEDWKAFYHFYLNMTVTLEYVG